MAEELNQQKTPRVKKIQEQLPVYRRKEDEVRFEIIDKIVSSLKWMIVLVAGILYFFYSIIITQNTTDAYQIKLLNEVNEKLSKQEQMLGIKFESQSRKALPGTCIVCHSPGRFDVVIPKDWKYENFKDYVRGNIRVPENKTMPAFGPNIITDQQLEEIFLNLKQ